jgi:hypothetical protein
MEVGAAYKTGVKGKGLWIKDGHSKGGFCFISSAGLDRMTTFSLSGPNWTIAKKVIPREYC